MTKDGKMIKVYEELFKNGYSKAEGFTVLHYLKYSLEIKGIDTIIQDNKLYMSGVNSLSGVIQFIQKQKIISAWDLPEVNICPSKLKVHNVKKVYSKTYTKPNIFVTESFLEDRDIEKDSSNLYEILENFLEV